MSQLLFLLASGATTAPEADSVAWFVIGFLLIGAAIIVASAFMGRQP